MRSITLKRLFAIVALASLAACQSTPQTKDTARTEQQKQQQETQQDFTQTEPVQPQQPLNPVVDETDKQKQQEATKPVTAQNFFKHPSTYTATTETRKIYFAFDQAAIPEAAYAALRAHARYLKAHENAVLRLEGHTDERGTREYNIALGQRRAESVQEFLLLHGVPSDQLKTVSYGEEKPAWTASTLMAYAHNRRVVLDYLAVAP